MFEVLMVVAALLLDAAMGYRASKKSEATNTNVLALIAKQDARLDNHEVRIVVLEKAA